MQPLIIQERKLAQTLPSFNGQQSLIKLQEVIQLQQKDSILMKHTYQLRIKNHNLDLQVHAQRFFRWIQLEDHVNEEQGSKR